MTDERIVSSLSVVSLSFLAIAIPLGVAGQNILFGISEAIFLGLVLRYADVRQVVRTVFRENQVIFLCGLVYCLWIGLATALAPESESWAMIKEPIGFASILFVPMIAGTLFRLLNTRDRIRAARFSFGVLIVWSVVCLSQALFSWQIEHGHIVNGSSRARGFVSHPLTLAYSAVIIWPWCQQWLLSQPRRLVAWVLFLAIGVIVWTSESRTVQLCCVLFLVIGILSFLRGKQRLIGFSAIGIFLVAALTIDSPVSKKIWATIEGKDVQESSFKDDRIAFWHANFHLFMKSPITGHGEAFPSRLLEQSYEEIGLGDLSKKYEAHNMYLSVLVHEGTVGLVIFLGWLFSLLCAAWRPQSRKKSFWDYGLLQSVAVLCLAAMTQNALQDSEVRFVFAASIALWMGMNRRSAALA